MLSAFSIFSAKGKSKSTTHGAFVGLYITSKIAALTKTVSSPNFRGEVPDSVKSTYAERCWSTFAGSTSNRSEVLVDQFVLSPPQPSCMWPKQWRRGRHLWTACRRFSQPTTSLLYAVISSIPCGGPCVSMISIWGHAGTGFKALIRAIGGLGLNRSILRG